MLTVDIDTGGTMTDALVSDGTRRYACKVDTTPHDYTVSLVACLKEAARALGYASVSDFLSRVSLLRWSSTITTNVLGERRGSKVGLLVTQGQEQALYGAGRSPIIGELVGEEVVIGLPRNPAPADILAGVKQLLEAGVRRICVCLADAFPDNRAECAIKTVIEDQYPDHIIGSVPVLLGSDMAQLRHDQTRAHYSVMNAYTHSQLANSLFKAEDLLRDEYGWNGALLIGHTSGGVARIGKTKAVDTIESGPVFGTFGGAHLAGLYGLKDVICFDVGGTTTKASVVRDGAPVFQRGGKLMDVPVRTSFAMLRSAVVGGGSVARVRDGGLVLGPESMGAAPGPACYNLGGDQATLTDALLVLGYLDPAKFLGGRRVVRANLAQAAIERNVAGPLAVSADVAALMIRDEAVAIMSDLVGSLLREAGLQAGATPLFAYGGNGPVFAALVADRLGLPAAYAFDLGPVFSAFGSAISDVLHRYERGLEGPWAAGDAFAGVVRLLRTQAERDLRGEGFDPARARYTWELDLGPVEAEASTVRAECELAAPGAVLDALTEAAGAAGLAGQATLAIRLLTRFAVGAHGVTRRSERTGTQAAGQRAARFDGRDADVVPVWCWESMNAGDRLAGPALVNGDTLTCPVPPGWRLAVDDYGNAVLSRGQ